VLLPSEDNAELREVERITNRLELAVLRGEDLQRLCLGLLGPEEGSALAKQMSCSGEWRPAILSPMRRKQAARMGRA
jgi:hypothetical protein